MAAVPFEVTVEFLVPFLFMFAVVFGVLEFSNAFKNRAVHAVVGFALAAFAATNTAIVSIITGFLPSAIWFFIIMFFLAFILKLFGLHERKQGQEMEGMIAGGAVLLVLLSVGYMILQEFPVEFPVIGSGNNLIFLIGFLVILSLFWGVMKIGSGEKPSRPIIIPTDEPRK